MNLYEYKDHIHGYLNRNKRTISAVVLGAFFFLAVGGFTTYIIMKRQVDQVNSDLKLLQESENSKEILKELNTVKKAIDDLKKNKPVTERVINNTETKVEYVEKQSKDDPDVEIRKAPPVAKIKYNEETFDVPMKTTKTNVTKEDGTVKVTEGQELTIDVTKVADRQIAAYKLSVDEAQRELNEELKKVKKENKVHKAIEYTAIAIGTGYLIHKALK